MMNGVVATCRDPLFFRFKEVSGLKSPYEVTILLTYCMLIYFFFAQTHVCSIPTFLGQILISLV